MCVAFDPDYSRKKARPIVCGGKSGKLVMFKKGYFNTYRETVIHEGEGTIYTVKWKANIIIWGNDKTIRLYDTETQKHIPCNYKREKDAPRADLFRCCIQFTESNQILVGWGNAVHILEIHAKPMTCTIVTAFKVDTGICGIAPFLNDNIFVLGFDEEATTQVDKKIVSPRPEIRVIDMKGNDIYADSVTVINYEENLAVNYRLEYSEFDKSYYVISQRDVIVAKPTDWDDKITWLLKNQRFTDAMEVFRKNEKQVMKYRYVDIANKKLNFLLQNNRYTEAAKLLPDIAGQDKELWNQWIKKYIEDKKFKVYLLLELLITNVRILLIIYLLIILGLMIQFMR